MILRVLKGNDVYNKTVTKQRNDARMTTNALVLGAGMVGSVIAEDLSTSGFKVTVVDVSTEALDRLTTRSSGEIGVEQMDCSDAASITAKALEVDIVFGALPSWLGLNALQAVIESGRSYCDISFMEEDPRVLNDLAKDRGVTCVVDFGVAPGMSHLLCSYATHILDSCDRLDIVVGGLPVDRTWPWEYKAPFSPRDVIDEYIRPARLVENGAIVTREALSETVLMELPNVGTLEAFNSDGLRTLCDTLDVPNIRERTLRYPGHAEMMKVLRAGGFFNSESIMVGDQEVRPIDLTSKLLINDWKYEQGEADLTVMRVEAEGSKDNKRTVLRWDLLDQYDSELDQSSMSRTTGFPCAAIGRMIVDQTIDSPGVHPPEVFGGRDDIVDRLFMELETRNVRYTQTMEFI
ncbi:MAG: saccharopine dehydrogenase C-terminal domain-containing protein [Planctomycetota bacterium]|nr:saccharopine dehydrogenase C-terminal domain-containing protein [Planctomycetota bacterium]